MQVFTSFIKVATLQAMLTPINWSRFHKDLPVTFVMMVVNISLWSVFN